MKPTNQKGGDERSTRGKRTRLQWGRVEGKEIQRKRGSIGIKRQKSRTMTLQRTLKCWDFGSKRANPPHQSLKKSGAARPWNFSRPGGKRTQRELEPGQHSATYWPGKRGRKRKNERGTADEKNLSSQVARTIAETNRGGRGRHRIETCKDSTEDRGN